MELETKKYDVANYLDSEEMIATYLDAATESGDASRIAEAKRDAMRAR
jgi:DNA-binding phage protein